jgi:hypothetical protein
MLYLPPSGKGKHSNRVVVGGMWRADNENDDDGESASGQANQITKTLTLLLPHGVLFFILRI